MALENVFSLFEESGYEEMFPEVHIMGTALDYFVQCSTYELLIPMQTFAEQKLDIFEDAVLKLLDYNPYTLEELSSKICLDKDVISFIKIRLRELGLLEKDEFTVSELGRDYLGGMANLNASVSYRQAKLFVLKDTGDILPYINYGEIKYAYVKESSRDHTVIEYGSAGMPLEVSGENLWARSSQGVHGGRLLKPDAIRNSLHLYNRIASNTVRYSPIKIVSDYSIDNSYAGDCWLHVKAAIQEGSADELIVSDGFVANNDILAKYLAKEFPDIISAIKTTAVHINNDLNEEVSCDKGHTNSRYRDLYQPMNNISAAYEKLMENTSGTSQDEYVEVQYEQKEFLLNCYAVIEHVLFVYLQNNPLKPDRLRLLKGQSGYQNKEFILMVAEQLGIGNIRSYDQLFGILNDKNIEKMYNTKTPNMSVALSMVIVEAFDDKDSLFRDLLNAYPSAVQTINKLHNKCKDLRHKASAYDVNVDYADKIYDFTTLLVEVLLPDFNYIGSNDIRLDSVTNKRNRRLIADISLAEAFGSMYYYSVMDETLKNEWRLVAPRKDQYPSPYEYMNILYRILQETLFEQVFYMKKKQMDKVQLLELGKKRWGSELASGLTRVHKNYIAKTISSKSTTLGAQALVYLCFCPDDKLTKLKQLKFDELVSKITGYREHGNNLALELDYKELGQLRDRVIDVTKAIGGI